eukprot:SAG11_NODE_4670_length_1813_cov_1.348308_4_plen_98_part_01
MAHRWPFLHQEHRSATTELKRRLINRPTVLAVFYHFNFLKIVRRGARKMNELKPAFPQTEWPTVDVFICHMSEPCIDTLTTLEKAMAMDYPVDKFNCW